MGSFVFAVKEMKFIRKRCISTNIAIIWIVCHVANSAKLEKWLDPSIESSVEPSALKSASRNPKLFFGTTTTVTSTLSTTTACYTTGTVTTSCSKKKRSISDEPIEGLEDASKIMPSSGTEVTKEHYKEKRKSNKKSSRRSSKVMDLNKLMAESKEAKIESRFLFFYWYTSTITSTSTSYTSTTTFTLTACTPAGSFAYAACG